jgi:hypothetical protein
LKLPRIAFNGAGAAFAAAPSPPIPAADPPKLLNRLLLGALAAYILLFVYFVYETRVLRPFADQLDLVHFYFRYQEVGGLFGYLFEPHTVHRLPFYRMLIALDVDVFGGTGLPFVVVAVLCFLGLAVMLAREAAAAAGPLKLALVVLSLRLLLGSTTAANLSVPANTPAVHAVFFTVLTIILAERVEGSNPVAIGWRRVGALAGAVAAAFTNAVGLVIWPLLAFKAWRGGKADRPWLALVLVFGGAFGLAYLAGQHGASGGFVFETASILKAVDYFFAFLGLPWARALAVEGRLIGVALFAAALFAIWSKGRCGASRAERIAVAFIVLSLGTALLAAIARKDVSAVVDVPARYRIYMVPMHIGLMMLATPWVERQWVLRRRVTQAALVACLSLLLVQQVLVGMVSSAAARHARETITAFHQGLRQPDMDWLIYPDIGHAQAIYDEMERRDVYYQGEAPRLPDDLW